jgi:hypothetical protein
VVVVVVVAPVLVVVVVVVAVVGINTEVITPLLDPNVSVAIDLNSPPVKTGNALRVPSVLERRCPITAPGGQSIPSGDL